ncbi:MAG: molybdopterin-dependent oxidoreductase [Desulfatiglandales bacterium]|jgi:xanthine dehydrogenase molybdenum-binding subunit|nr:molybdopterin-dependent oxidoreductase [Desulfatiglandales bacterium]
MENKFSLIGKNVPRIDAIDKVTGRARYGIDMKMDDMLYAKLLRSPYPHARVVKIDTRKAESHPNVKGVATINEIPKVVGTIGNLMTKRGRDKLYLRDNVVRFIGDPVAAVAADDEESAEEALSFIEVNYEQLPNLFDPVEALKENAPKIHEDGNVAFHLLRELGDIEKGFKEADHIFENRFVTSKQKHATMDPMSSCIANYDQSGKLTVYSSTQRPHIIKIFLSGALGVPINRVRIIKQYTGGSFGGRDYLIHGLETMCSLLSKKTGKPVKMSFTREEDFEATESRHPFILELKTGVTRDGILTVRHIKAVMDVGGYGPHAIGVLHYAMRQGVALYRCPNLTFEGHSVHTNKSLCGAMRGYGNPQMNFAVESQMDIIAKKLGIDPVELRLKNYRGLGEIDPLTGDKIQSDGMKECLREGAKKISWKEKRSKKIAGETKKRGLGMSCLAHGSGGRFDIPDPTSATVMFNSDGSVNLVTAAIDDGQGLKTVFTQIAAEELGIDLEQISVSESDTDLTPFDSGTHGSRQTYAGGNIVRNAAAEAKDSLLTLVSRHLNVKKEDLKMKDGVVYDVKEPNNKIHVGDFLTGLLFEDLSTGKQIQGFATGVAPGSPPVFAGNFAEVEVDIETGQVSVLRLIGAFDVGRAMNPAHVEGQITGGEIMGIGYALTEGLVIRDGKICNNNFTDYRILRACDAPAIDAIIVESHEPTAAFGAKGVGEITNVGTASAIANAIFDAVGIRVTELPITQEKVFGGLHSEGREG